jgi:hypothetical protein
VKHSRLFVILSLIFAFVIILAIPTIIFIKPFLPFKNYLLGIPKPSSYLILLGNDSEIRTNGGFAGSYAKVIANYPNFDLSFQDIYVPNGQLQGYVAPPAPIQEAFQHGTWQLANADWEPDFATSASSIRWFMEKGGEINPDNLIILNLTSIKKILDVVGSFTVPEYEAKITPDNLYLFLQGKAEVNFFPGSTQKKDALTAVGQALKKVILSLPLNKKLKIVQIFYQDLVNQNIVVNSTNQSFQTFLESKNFAGRLASNTPDTFLMIEANLGANKANAFVKRQTTHNISFANNQTSHKIKVELSNSSPEANPNPPFHYGGDYKTYIRLYIPQNAQNVQLASESGTIKTAPANKYGLTELGFWQTTKAQNQSQFSLSYTLPVSKDQYSLTILKQHGLVTSPQTINIEEKSISTSLENDFKTIR